MNTKDEVRRIRIQEWKKIFEDKAASGLSAKDYCLKNGIGKDQYFYWQRIVRDSVLTEMKDSKFTELSVPVSTDMFFALSVPSPISITVGKGTITVQDKESLRMVMEVLLSAQ
ncbi:MAG: hypothetical protein K6F64_09630 [Clostridia bacterium]|nr:hypothetical protein [Clostridia bacterium]